MRRPRSQPRGSHPAVARSGNARGVPSGGRAGAASRARGGCAGQLAGLAAVRHLPSQPRADFQVRPGLRAQRSSARGLPERGGASPRSVGGSGGTDVASSGPRAPPASVCCAREVAFSLWESFWIPACCQVLESIPTSLPPFEGPTPPWNLPCSPVLCLLWALTTADSNSSLTCLPPRFRGHTLLGLISLRLPLTCI